MIILKCLIDYKIINSEEKTVKNNIISDYTNNTLSYKDESDNMKLIINKDNIIMIKDNLTSITTLNFIKNKKTDSEYKIKVLNTIIDMKVLTNKLEINDDKIHIEYEIWFDEEYSGKFEFEISIKEME